MLVYLLFSSSNYCIVKLIAHTDGLITLVNGTVTDSATQGRFISIVKKPLNELLCAIGQSDFRLQKPLFRLTIVAPQIPQTVNLFIYLYVCL